jgi:hypothetical protein
VCAVGKGTQCANLVRDYNFVHLSGTLLPLLPVPQHPSLASHSHPLLPFYNMWTQLVTSSERSKTDLDPSTER